MAEDSSKWGKKSRPGTARGAEENENNTNVGNSVSQKQLFSSDDVQYSMGHSSKSSVTKGLTYRDNLEQSYPPPIGKKHKAMGMKAIQTMKNHGINIKNIQSAVARGVAKNGRKIARKQNDASEQQTKELSAADKEKLSMMSDYFAEKVDEYGDMILKCEEDARRRRAKNKKMGIEKKNELPPFEMSRKFYGILESDQASIYAGYRRLKSRHSNYDHILFDDVIREGFQNKFYKIQFIHLVTKPYQCWQNLFEIDENAAKELSDFGLLLLEHFNKTGRFRRTFPKWLIELRGWEQSISHKYLTSPVYIMEVVDYIKDGTYWARYHPYLREEDDEVYIAKWSDGTDLFPHRMNTLYWWYTASGEDHWMTIEEYMQRKAQNNVNNKSMKNVNHKQSRKSFEDDESALNELKKQKSENSRYGDDDVSDGDNEYETDEDEVGYAQMSKIKALEFDNLSISEVEMSDDDDAENESLSSVETESSMPVNCDVYRCPMLKEDEFDCFAGWTAFHRSFVDFISRDLLNIGECEREIARNPNEDHWRRRHLSLGNGFDFPICQYRLISKKLNLEHEVRENLRMIAMLKKNGISANAQLTQTKYAPNWIEYKAKTHFESLMPQIRAQQNAYSPQKKELLSTLAQEIERRQAFNEQIRLRTEAKKEKLQKYLSSLKSLNERQISLLDYIVSAKHRVANAKLKVQFARQQVEILERDVEDLRSMTPREQAFADRNKEYSERVSIKKLCKQYHSLKRNNYDPNKAFLSEYRQKIKQKIKKCALYNLWFWAIKERYKTHQKLNVILRGFEMMNPTKDWNPSNAQITELLLNNEKYHKLNNYDPHKLRKEQILFKLKEEQSKAAMSALDEEENKNDEEKNEEQKVKISEIVQDDIDFYAVFERMKQQTQRFAILNGANIEDESKRYEHQLNELFHLLQGIQQQNGNKERHKRGSVVSRGRPRRESETFLLGMSNAKNQNAEDANKENEFDLVMAGGQRVAKDSDFDTDVDDDDDFTDGGDEYDDESQNTEEEASEYSQSSQSHSVDDGHQNNASSSRIRSIGQIYEESDYTDESSGVLHTESSASEYSLDSYTPSYDEEDDGGRRSRSHSRNPTEFLDESEYGQSMSRVMGYNMGSSIASGLNENQNYIGGDHHRPVHPDDDGMDSEEQLYSDDESHSFTENSESESENGQMQRRQQASFSVVRNNAMYNDEDGDNDGSSSVYKTEEDDDD